MEEEQVEGAERGAYTATAVAGAAYGVLFVLGAVFGVVSGFEHSWNLWEPVPPIPIVLTLLLFGLLYSAGRLMGTRLGAFVPGLGWMLVALLFSTRKSEGDLVIAGDAPGYWFLLGGALALVVAVLLIPSSTSWLLHQGAYGRRRPVDVSDGRSA
ncbi:DUF6113 family protein [Sphaerisporangium sp. TRM90804]|uniref:DUF6113 family protein n=1 Tax=Sphaerisporangium sp. TRM90804 TaxID=3031113 RepID=UPI00244C15B8|nr:DUF6113 family protein [Sphaerisporangium sp. TRM90804]MDH2429898.1 DUF6113 family protein [Sphaerisporangium sp. TRM90804]